MEEKPSIGLQETGSPRLLCCHIISIPPISAGAGVSFGMWRHHHCWGGRGGSSSPRWVAELPFWILGLFPRGRNTGAHPCPACLSASSTREYGVFWACSWSPSQLAESAWCVAFRASPAQVQEVLAQEICNFPFGLSATARWQQNIVWLLFVLSAHTHV